MKTIIQLLIAVVIVYACAHAGEAAWRHFQFRDAVEQEARYGPHKTTSQLHRRVIELAAEYDIPLEYTDVTVERHNDETAVAVAYVEEIQLVPATYSREHLFEFEMSVRGMHPLTVDDRR